MTTPLAPPVLADEPAALAETILHYIGGKSSDVLAATHAVLSLVAQARQGREDAAILKRLEWADTILCCDEETSDPNRRFSFRDMATPPSPESPDGTLYGPTVRAVVLKAIAAATPSPSPEGGR